ncbi:FmdB family zinc ribbon protein [Solimonas marina]|uniref:Zinc ribbon domain-containing protein n=1 Tax=Solimonas marina TaxID=2714601 RepID=A0A970B8H1_9GAMM|nr:zinc ribbon domain-containing protein [Solimonas marina]NKF24740.1 zinc ribbon domain-containing protein [Solimonas marina]
MPIYDYHCTACGADSEILQKISDPPETECPVCGKSALVKQVSASGFRLSGGGWYETDFKSGNKKNLAGESASTASTTSSEKKSDSSSSSSAGGDSKPAGGSSKGEAAA